MGFNNEVEERINANGNNEELKKKTSAFMNVSLECQYSYNFSWLGRPIIQYPQDMVAMQEIIWKVQPDLIIETGIAHGGSLIFSASMLELNSICGGNADAEVLGVDIDICPHNRAAIEAHPLFSRISMIEGSSVEPKIIEKVRNMACDKKKVLLFLDSNHTHNHVLAELNAYSDLVSLGSYCVVFDTIVEDAAEQCAKARPWGKGDNPKTAVWEFLKVHDEFKVDKSIQDKLLVTVAPEGYLMRVR